MIGTIVLSLAMLVIFIGLITHKLNSKPLCQHDWREIEGGLRCEKCTKIIRQTISQHSSHNDGAPYPHHPANEVIEDEGVFSFLNESDVEEAELS